MIETTGMNPAAANPIIVGENRTIDQLVTVRLMEEKLVQKELILKVRIKAKVKTWLISKLWHKALDRIFLLLELDKPFLS